MKFSKIFSIDLDFFLNSTHQLNEKFLHLQRQKWKSVWPRVSLSKLDVVECVGADGEAGTYSAAAWWSASVPLRILLPRCGRPHRWSDTAGSWTWTLLCSEGTDGRHYSSSSQKKENQDDVTIDNSDQYFGGDRCSHEASALAWRWSSRRPGVATRMLTPLASFWASAERLLPPMMRP